MVPMSPAGWSGPSPRNDFNPIGLAPFPPMNMVNPNPHAAYPNPPSSHLLPGNPNSQLDGYGSGGVHVGG